MKLSCTRFISACILLALPGVAMSAEVSVDATSIVRFEQNADPQNKFKKDVIPVTQFLGLDVDKLADGNLSLHASGWGRYDVREKSFNSDRGAGSLNYGYLQYRFNKSSDARLGRFFIHEGIANEHIDGLSVRTELPFGVGLSAFGGANVHTKKIYGEKSDGKGEAVFGGRVNYRYRGILELGASGVYETNVPVLLSNTRGDRRLVGGDVWFSPFRMMEIMGHTSYNIETKGVAEHTYMMNIKPTRHLRLSGEYNEHREKNYLFSSFQFPETAPDSAEKSKTFGGNVTYELSKNLEITGDYKHFKRNIGKADRYGADVKVSFLDNSFRGGIGYHYLNAGREFAIRETDNASASFHEMRVYALYDTKTYFISADALNYLFKEKIYNEKNAWEAIGSLGYHITPGLTVSGDFSYGRNALFTQEVKGLARLTYNMNMTFDNKGGMK